MFSAQSLILRIPKRALVTRFPIHSSHLRGCTAVSRRQAHQIRNMSHSQNPQDEQAQNGSKFSHLPLSTSGPLECALKGTVLLNHPYFNKGSAFTKEERRDFALHGLLPPHIQSLEQQVQRAYEQYCSQPNDLAKNTFMTSMKEQNEVLFYRVRLHFCSVQRSIAIVLGCPLF